MFDTHCHLNFDFFDDKLKDVITDARTVGVERFVIPGTDIESSKKAVKIAEQYKNVYAAVGIHPTEDLEKVGMSKIIEQLREMVEDGEKIVAIGEVGLDYYRFKSPASLQIEFLKEQIKLAKKLGLSIVFHNRVATKDFLRTVDEMWDSSLKGKMVFHACSADKTILEFAKKKRVFIGVDGDVTYDEEKAEFIKQVPLELLVLETDSPFLTPRPVRNGSHENEPKNLKHIADFISSLKGVSLDGLKKATTSNALSLFNL